MNINVSRLLASLGIQAERRGSELWAACPFKGHDEKEASWSVDQLKGAHYCFGCSRGGGPLELIMFALGTGYSSARRWVEDHGLEEDDACGLRAELVIAAPQRRVYTLPLTVRGIGALDTWPRSAALYAAARGITAEQISRWSIGYAVDGRLARRIVIPFHDAEGAVQTYSARGYSGQRVRYLTPHTEEGPDKSAMFGPLHWPKVAKRSTVVCCEGAINALACERAGAEAIAALNGSALYPAQVAALGTFPEIVTAFDPDQAGERVTLALRGALSRWRRVRCATISVGSDPADMSADALQQALFPDGIPRS